MSGRVDWKSGNAVVIQAAHTKIHDGLFFVTSYKTPDASPLADNAAIDFLIITNSKDIHLIYFASGNNDLETVVYENTVISNNGTLLPAVGINRVRSLNPEATVYRDPTITNVGDQLFNDFRAWGINTESFLERVWIFKPNSNYLIRTINRAGSAQPVSLVVEWYIEGARN